MKILMIIVLHLLHWAKESKAVGKTDFQKKIVFIKLTQNILAYRKRFEDMYMLS